jgi:membrane-associated phospholipid phosphatase
MIRRTRIALCASLLVVGTTAVSCKESTTFTAPAEVAIDSATASVRWNQRAVALVVARQPTGNGQAAVSRIMTYLSLAQYRAVVATLAVKGTKRPSMSAAVAGASVVVLNSFFPLDVASTEAQLKGDLATPSKGDAAAGEALGRTVGAAVLAQVASDNYLVASPGATPVGADRWVSSPAPVVRSLYGTRPFFLTSPSQLRPPAPPVAGSAAFTTALAEVRQIASTRTAAQIKIAQDWNTSSGPFTAGSLNLIADDLIRERQLSEPAAALLLAYANAAAFDAQIACWDAKFTYWSMRPSQVDPAITMAIALPNHPSYPSGHSCMTAGFMGVVRAAFPQERARLDAMVDEAGMSRVYGGIHYRFDIDAGRDIGAAAAVLALNGSLR